IEEIYGRTKIDRWFLNNLRDLVEVEERLRACPNLTTAMDDLLWEAKQHGFSDRQLAHVWHTSEGEVRRIRKARGVVPVYKLVDTCAAELEAYTPFYYSTYERPAVLATGDVPVGTSDAETRPPNDGRQRI